MAFLSLARRETGSCVKEKPSEWSTGGIMGWCVSDMLDTQLRLKQIRSKRAWPCVAQPGCGASQEKMSLWNGWISQCAGTEAPMLPLSPALLWGFRSCFACRRALPSGPRQGATRGQAFSPVRSCLRTLPPARHPFGVYITVMSAPSYTRLQTSRGACTLQ